MASPRRGERGRAGAQEGRAGGVPGAEEGEGLTCLGVRARVCSRRLCCDRPWNPLLNTAQGGEASSRESDGKAWDGAAEETQQTARAAGWAASARGVTQTALRSLLPTVCFPGPCPAQPPPPVHPGPGRASDSPAQLLPEAQAQAPPQLRLGKLRSWNAPGSRESPSAMPGFSGRWQHHQTPGGQLGLCPQNQGDRYLPLKVMLRGFNLETFLISMHRMKIITQL